MNTDFYLILDTNVYRTLVHNRSYEEVRTIASLIATQNKRLKLQPLIEMASCMELISHVQDNGRHRDSCRKSILLMSLICSHEYLIPTPEIEIAKKYFGIILDNPANIAHQTAGLALEIAKYEANEYNEILSHDVEVVKKIVHKKETQMRNDFYLSIRQKDGKSSTWQLFQNDKQKRKAHLDYLQSDVFLDYIANLQLKVITNLSLKEKKENALTPEKKRFFLKDYPNRYIASMEMQRIFLEKFINCNFDLEAKQDRVNYHWDCIILHSAGQLFNNKPIVIVSNDKDLVKSAQKANTMIWNIEEYLSKLDLDIFKSVSKE